MGFAPSVKWSRVGVDARVELMSTIFRLAGNQEYAPRNILPYEGDVAAYFGPYREHPAVAMAAALRKERHIGYGAPLSLGLHLTNAYALKPRALLEPRPPGLGLDWRWQPDEAEAFLRSARGLVKESRFKDFVKAHRPFYRVVAARMRRALDHYGHPEWFRDFFGAEAERELHVAVGLLASHFSAGVTVRKQEKIESHSIQAIHHVDSGGLPCFDSNTVVSIIHEFAHSYVNPVIYDHIDQFERSGKALFALATAASADMVYELWDEVICESVIRACEVSYCQAYGLQSDGGATVARHEAEGFTWVGALAEVLGEYEADRRSYPTFESFVPQLAMFFAQYVASIESTGPPQGSS